jgi:hypothetical protein
MFSGYTYLHHPPTSPYGLFFPKVALTTENEACILREVTDGLLRREIWIQANAEDDKAVRGGGRVMQVSIDTS